jgi:hypothetical protein
MKTAAVVIAALFIAGCGQKPMASATTGNPELPASKMFTYDGCTVYRFSDYGQPHYFAKCDGKAASTQWSESCGKGCQRQVSVEGGAQ